MTPVVELDVSDLAPPDPLVQIITVLSTLAEQQILKVKHRREPFPLYEKLVAAGWCHQCVKVTTDHYRIYIYRPSIQALAQTVIAQDNQ